MKIAICDDEKFFREEVKRATYTYSNMHRLEIAIDEYTSGEDLLRSEYEYDIIILDYQMGGINGLETARILRKENINCIIIFMTNYPDFIYESFEVSTYRFFAKPLNVSKFYKAFDDYFETFGNNYPLLLKLNRDTITIHTKDIVYLEANNKKCYINMINARYLCAKTMAAVAEMLPKKNFYKVHKSFIVNFNYVQKYDNKHIYFKNTTSAYMSRKYYTAFKDAYRIFAYGRKI